MSTQEIRQCLERDMRNAQRRRILSDLDLNNPPTGDNVTPADISFHSNSQQFPPEACRGYQQEIRNCIEVIDDDVAIIDQSLFDEAKINSRRNRSQVIHGLRDVLTGADGLLNSLSELANWYCNQRRNVPDEAITSGNVSVDVKVRIRNKLKARMVAKPPEFQQNPEPEAPTLSCPICMGPLNEATTTKCGHIFCEDCIKKAIVAQGKCPICRKKLGKRGGIIRIYLPTSN